MRKVSAGDVARTNTLNATWILAFTCTAVPLPNAKTTEEELEMLQEDDATAEVRGLPTYATQT